MNETLTPSSVIHNGDCREVMATLAADSIDSIVTDPPYGLSFMGKGWDHGVPGVEFWVEALRIAKPGAHLLAFGGSRTYHRLACAIEDAGWEVRDCIMWVYGSGFPKSHDVSKAIDREAGAEREVVGESTTINQKNSMILKASKNHPEFGDRIPVTAPSTEAAKQWQGWGTALKPAYEPIIVARKPLIGTVSHNVLEHGTGGINVDGCRVGMEKRHARENNTSWGIDRIGNPNEIRGNKAIGSTTLGRWPANFIHDGSDEVMGLFPNSKSIGGTNPANQNKIYVERKSLEYFHYGDSGSAARFFYTAKASKADRDEGCEGMEERMRNQKHYAQADQSGKTVLTPDGGTTVRGVSHLPQRNHHPTVKPTDLMRYLCRLVTPPDGTVLDPFCGSGSTGKGAILEGFNFIGIEREAEYVEIAMARTEWARKHYQPTLF